MNIFWLDEDFEKSASYYMDTHVRKILLECAQIASTTCHYMGIPVRYRATHVNHPLCVWARKSEDNYLTVLYMIVCLNEEYKFRRGSDVDHASFIYAMSLPTPDFENKEFTDPPLCMPDSCKVGNLVESYREYYKVSKRHLARWTKRGAPDWWE